MSFDYIIDDIDEFREINYYDDIFGYGMYRVPKKYIRDIENPFHMRDEEFRRRFRFSQESVFFIVDLLRPQLEKPSNRGLPVAPEIAVLVTLRFYATASFQIVCAGLFSLSQGTVSNTVTKVSDLLGKLVHRYSPEGAQISENRQKFMELGKHGRWPGLSGIDGAIDCSHVKIVSTPGCAHHEAYRNRKSFFSINVQVVVGPNTEILDIVARWAGSSHDSRIFQMSSVYMRYHQGLLDGRLVGDSGYPTLPFVLTPVRASPEDPPSIRYNRAQIKTRNVVERTFLKVKRRFPCLRRGLGNQLSTVCKIILACVVLHNLSLQVNDHTIIPDGDDEEEPEDVPQHIIQFPNIESGFVLRNMIITSNYT